MNPPINPQQAAVQRCAEAIRFEAEMVKASADILLRKIADWNQVANLDANAWRCVVQAVYERIEEVVS